MGGRLARIVSLLTLSFALRAAGGEVHYPRGSIADTAYEYEIDAGEDYTGVNLHTGGWVVPSPDKLDIVIDSNGSFPYAVPTSVTVVSGNDGGAEVEVGNLTINSKAGANERYADVSLIFEASEGDIQIGFDSIVATGSANNTTSITLTGADNNTTINAGSTSLGPNSVLTMTGGSATTSLNAGALTITGAVGATETDIMDVYVLVGEDTSLTSSNLTMNGIAQDTVNVEGTLSLTGAANTVSAGSVNVAGGVLNLGGAGAAQLSLNSAEASLNVSGTVSFTTAGSGIALYDDAAMTIDGATVATGTGTINNASGTLAVNAAFTGTGTTIQNFSTATIAPNVTASVANYFQNDGETTVASGAALNVSTAWNLFAGTFDVDGSGTVTAGAATVGGVGELNLNDNSRFTADVFNQENGTTNVAANAALAATTTLNASNGVINVDGTVTAATANASGAAININRGGSVTAGNYNQTAGTTTVASGGTLVADTALNVSGGLLNVKGTDAGNYGRVSAATATVSGSGVVDIDAFGRFTANVFNQNGGSTTVDADGLLTVVAELNATGGSLVIDGTVDASSATTTVDGGSVAINTGGKLDTNVYIQNSTTVTVATGGALVARTALNLAGGTLNVDGTVDAPTANATVSGAAALNVNDGGSMTVGSLTQTNGTVNVLAGGALVSNGAIVLRDGVFNVAGTASGASYNQSGGDAQVATGGELTISGASTVSDGNLTISGTATMPTLTQTGGVVLVDSGGVLVSTNLIAVQNGDFTVRGEVNAHDFTQTGGTVDVASGGVLNSDGTMTLQDGVTTVGGTVNAVNVVSRSDDVTIENGGKIVATSGFTVADGVVTVEESGLLDVSAGRLTVSGGLLDLHGPATALDMSFSGGAVNLRDNGTLNVANAVVNARGTLHMYGGAATFAVGIEFTAGGVVNHDAGSEIAAALLTIGENATLDVSEAGMRVTGDLVLAGTYSLDYDAASGTLNMVDLIGNLDVRQTVKVAFTQEVVDYVMDQGGAVRILASDGLMDGVAAGNFPESYRYGIYAYYLSLVADGDNSGLYIDRMRILELNELRRYMIDDWNQHRDVRGHAENLINGDLVNAVLQGSLDYSDPDVKLSHAGYENARNLFNIGEGPVNSSYSALMLYNGAGLAVANQAHLATGGQILDVLGGRLGLLRQGPSSIATCEDAFGNRILEPADRFGNRVWASGFGAEQTLKWKDGFTGYKYRPYGVSVGFDRDFGDLVLGVAATYANGKYEDHAAERNDSRISGLSGSLYGMYRLRETGLFLGGSVGVVRFDNDIRDMRTMRNNVDALSRGWNSAEYNASGWLAHGRLGYDMRFGGNFTVTPSVGIRHVYAESDSHRQNFRPLDGSAEYNTLVAGKVDNHSTTVPFELSFNYNFIGEEDAVLSVFGSVGYAYELNEDAARGTIGYGGLSSYPAVAIAGRTAGRDVLMAGLGMNYIYDRYEFSADYRLTARDKYYVHYVNGLVSVKF